MHRTVSLTQLRSRLPVPSLARLRERLPIAGPVLALVVSLAAGGSAGHFGSALAHRTVVADSASNHRALALLEDRAGRTQLVPAAGVPAPAPASIANGPALTPHELFGFAPYWMLGNLTGSELRSLTTVAYFGVDVNGDGSLVRSGNGWDGYRSQDLVNLVNTAHSMGDRVVLTAKTFDPAAIHRLSSDPAAARRLGAELVQAVSAMNMDGANLDFEGIGAQDRHGFTNFVAEVSNQLHANNPRWQVTVDTYSGSASNSDGFFDVPAIASVVDGLFVMTYDMYSDGVASPNAPLGAGPINDLDAMAAYVAVVPSEKVIMGNPFYGYDWPTVDNSPGARATGSSTPVSYATISASGHPRYWDSAASVPWTAYKDGNQWHEIYYDDPQSLSLKAQLVNRFHLRGLGIWALGMDGGDIQMFSALLGHAVPLKEIVNGPSSLPSAVPAPQPGSGAQPPASGHPSPRPTPSPTPSPSPSPGSGPGPVPSPPPPPPSPTPIPIPLPSPH